MIENFGENLKLLRKKIDLTQEEIAKILNVSTQSISRWETNMGYPDIEMLPVIANFFGVTVDSLLGLDNDRKKEKISEIVKEVYSYKTKGENKTCIEICRRALKEFPNVFQLMYTLSTCLFNYGKNEEEIIGNNEEVIEICESILRDCKDDSIRQSAIQLLCFTYPLFDKRDKALEMAESMPNYYVTSNELLKNVLSGDKKIQHIQSNLLNLLQIISNNVEDLFLLNKNFEEKIDILKSLLIVYKGFFDKEDYYFFNWRIHRIYRYMAAVYADNKKYDETLEHIVKAADYAITVDIRPEEYKYTSSIFIGFESSIQNSVKKTTNNYSWVLLEKLSDERYDFIRNDPKFLNVNEKLKQIAKE